MAQSGGGHIDIDQEPVQRLAEPRDADGQKDGRPSPMPFGIEGADWNVLEIERAPVAEQHHLDEPHEQRRDLLVKVAIGVEADAARDHALARRAPSMSARPGPVAEAVRAFPQTRQEIINQISTCDPYRDKSVSPGNGSIRSANATTQEC